MSSASLVDFRGNWPPEEAEVVAAAVEQAEAAGLPASPDPIPPWVAIRRVVGTTSLYMASRHRAEDGLLGRSPSGLAERIRQFAAQHTDSSVGSDDREDTQPEGHDLVQLVYESEATRPMDEEALRELLHTAREKNERLGITGLLLHADDRFLQVLEGPEEAVRTVYATIRRDPRHTAVETLYTSSISQRTFAEWSMGLENLDLVRGEEGTSEFLQSGSLRGAAEPIAPLVDALERFRHSRSNS